MFLPVVLLFGLLIGRLGTATGAVVFLLLAGLFFYGWFRWTYLPLLVLSIVGNFLIGTRLIASSRKVLLVVAVAVNLGVLGFYKYALFFTSIFGIEVAGLGRLVLPLAISFYTFQQISFLVDCYRGEIEKVDFLKYALYVSFFPQLIAGPIVRFSELYPQLSEQLFRADANMIARGLTLFLFGLAKKVLIADVLARPVNSVWAGITGEVGVPTLDVWLAVFAYSFQIYFDFSAYSDMALGLGLMMGVALPVNFLSPYRSASIREFWQRWHITLSRWLRDYLYILLGGNRKGRNRQVLAIFVTMALGGLWHGAGWNFILWGVLHGIWIALTHLVRARAQMSSDAISGHESTQASAVKRIFAIGLTFLGVSFLWIFFRGEQGLWLQMFPALFSFNEVVDPHFQNFEITIFIIAGLIVFLAPANAAVFRMQADLKSRLQFSPSIGFALSSVVLFFLCAVLIIEGTPNAFIYFQF